MFKATYKTIIIALVISGTGAGNAKPNAEIDSGNRPIKMQCYFDSRTDKYFENKDPHYYNNSGGNYSLFYSQIYSFPIDFGYEDRDEVRRIFLELIDSKIKNSGYGGFPNLCNINTDLRTKELLKTEFYSAGQTVEPDYHVTRIAHPIQDYFPDWDDAKIKDYSVKRTMKPATNPAAAPATLPSKKPGLIVGGSNDPIPAAKPAPKPVAKPAAVAKPAPKPVAKPSVAKKQEPSCGVKGKPACQARGDR